MDMVGWVSESALAYLIFAQAKTLYPIFWNSAAAPSGGTKTNELFIAPNKAAQIARWCLVWLVVTQGFLYILFSLVLNDNGDYLKPTRVCVCVC